MHIDRIGYDGSGTVMTRIVFSEHKPPNCAACGAGVPTISVYYRDPHTVEPGDEPRAEGDGAAVNAEVDEIAAAIAGLRPFSFEARVRMIEYLIAWATDPATQSHDYNPTRTMRVDFDFKWTPPQSWKDEAQRRSFAYGNANISNPDVTREMVADAGSSRVAREVVSLTQAGMRRALSVACAKCGARPNEPCDVPHSSSAAHAQRYLDAHDTRT
jgi:hypothetical protein